MVSGIRPVPVTSRRQIRDVAPSPVVTASFPADHAAAERHR